MSVEIMRKFYLRFVSIYGEKFTRNHPSDELVKMWWYDWYDGLLGIDEKHIKDAFNYCMLNLEWPPSLAEFRKICEKLSGLPDYLECMQAAIRRDFYHPIIKSIYDKIGSWNMQQDSETILTSKFKQYYQDEIANYRLKVQREAKLLEGNKLRIINNAAQGSEANQSRDTANYNTRGTRYA